jgi:hypothetical protein
VLAVNAMTAQHLVRKFQANRDIFMAGIVKFMPTQGLPGGLGCR